MRTTLTVCSKSWRKPRQVIGLVALLLWVLPACKSSQDSASPAPVEDASVAATPSTAVIDIEDPASCKPCHGTIVAEWEQSMHARAHHSRDPIYAGIRKIRLAKEGPELASACASCHTPRAAQMQSEASGGDAEKLETIAARGVSCATCHHLASVEPGKHGAAALKRPTDLTMAGPHDLLPDLSPAHKTGAAPGFMKDGTTLCLACHAEMRSASGVPICTTGPEAHELGGTETCVSCHMPTIKGPAGQVGQRPEHASHVFLGPHQAWYGNQRDAGVGELARAVDATATLGPDGLTATVVNKTGHAYPSGFPGRFAAILAVGVDAGGKEVWRSDPTPLRKRYVDAAGKPTLAPYAARIAEDSRLKPGESRKLTWAPPASVVTAKLVLVVRLVPPPLAKKLGLTGQLEAEPRKVTLTEVRRAP